MIVPGKHAVIVGQNGSGKSQQLIYLARNNEQPVVVFDTKIDDDFIHLATPSQKLVVVNNFREFLKALKQKDWHYLIVRPQKFELSNPIALDNYLDVLNELKALTICIDEAYPFHGKAGRCYQGLLALLTRGRSRKLSVICCTQRPSWVSNFIYSESSYFFIYRLVQKKDRKTISDMIPYNEEVPENYHYFYYDLIEGGAECELKEPIKLFKRRPLPKKKTISLLGVKTYA